MIPQGIPPPDALRARVRASIAETPPSRIGRPARMAIATVSAAVAIVVGVAKIRPDMQLGPSHALVALTAVLIVLAVATSVAGLARGRLGLGAPLLTLLVLAVATVPLYAMATMMWPVAGPEAPPHGETGCFSIALACGAVVLAGLTFALRRSVPAAPVARGALVGACAGAWAGLAVHLHCPAVGREHLLVGHILPLAIATLIGLLVVPRFLKP